MPNSDGRFWPVSARRIEQFNIYAEKIKRWKTLRGFPPYDPIIKSR
jgi:hypothetical protein